MGFLISISKLSKFRSDLRSIHPTRNRVTEFAKIKFNNNTDESKETKNVAIWIFNQILKISHPLIPFITENLWKKINNNNDFLMNQYFENFNINKNFLESHSNIKNLIEIITAIRNLRSELNISYKNLIDINNFNNENNFIIFLKEHSNELIKLLKINNLSYNLNNNKVKGAAYIVISKTTIIIPLNKLIDTSIELKKLHSKKKNAQNSLNSINSKLSNQSFLKKAPLEIIEKFKNEANDIKSSIEKLDQIINTIN